MKQKLLRLREQASRAALKGSVVLMASPVGMALAQTVPTDVETELGNAKTTILAIVAVGGAALLAIALAKVGWNVGSKWISRLGGKG